MRLVLLTDEGPRDIVLEVGATDATVGDVLDLLGSDRTGLTVDGRFVARDHTLEEAALHDGARIRPAGGSGTSPSATAPTAVTEHAGPWLVSTGGLDAGRWWALTDDRTVIGRDPACDVTLDTLTVSGRHAELRVGPGGVVQVADLGSTNGTWIDGAALSEASRLEPGRVLRLGAVTFEVVASLGTDQPAGAARHRGPWSFNRPPRPAPPPTPDPVRPPDPRRDVAPPQRLGWASMLTPIVMAVAMVLVFDNPMFALFAIISPLTIVGSWWESRRRNRADRGHEAARHAQELERFRADVGSAIAAEHRRRQDQAPHLGEVARRVTRPSTRLWERRPSHDDAFTVGVGTADVAYRPPLTDRARPSPEAAALLEELGHLPRTATPLDLAEGGVVGVVGRRAAAVAVARGLVLQLATHHGPADLSATLLVDDQHTPDWAWAGWLPHARDTRDRDRDRVITDRVAIESIADAWLQEPAQVGVTRLVVVDAPGLTEGRRAPVRAVLNGDAGPVVGVVVAETADRLPAACRYVVETLDEDGTACVTAPGDGRGRTEVLAWGVSAATARETARAMARFEDAELLDATASLPASTALPTLLPCGLAGPDRALAHWRGQPTDPGLRVPLGIGPGGPVWLDLVADGPHALIGGTTGSGKSELLRSLVVGLACQVDPAHLNIVLIDYKGGSAFDVCADLPHTVGVVTDLDEHLGARALRCLEAELHHREAVLRAAGATDLPAYLRLRVAATEPLPRLLVVIDEFATVATELPDFLDALVGIAQRGRSLGVHLVLATQRPSGVINDNIRANTNLRIALRVQDAADAVDVVGVPDPAGIPRDLPGRAYVRLGPGEVVPVQTAYASGRTEADAARVRLRRLDGAPLVPAAAAATSDEAQPSDLERLVITLRRAAEAGGYREPRTPWPDPLPTDLGLDLASINAAEPPGAGPTVARVGLLDEPDRQRQVPTGWELDAGNLLVFGIPGSGTTTTLSSLALALAAAHGPDALHLFVADADRGELRPLEALPHVGAVITGEQTERQRRLVRHLAREVEQRRVHGHHGRPRLVLLLDGYAAFRSAFDDHHDLDLLEALARVLAEGPGVRVHVAATAVRAGDVPGAVLSAIAQRWVHRLADAYDLSAFGVSPAAVPELPPGRVVLTGSLGLAQIGRVADLAVAVAEVAAATRPVAERQLPPTLGTLPERVEPGEIGALEIEGEVWSVPLGVADDDLAPARVRLHPGEHLLVAGPARSGRSSVLGCLARLAEAADVEVVRVAARRSPLRLGPGRLLAIDALTSWLGARPPDRPALLLVDDADLVDDPDDVLARLAKDHDSPVRIVAAGRGDALRSSYGHWTHAVRRSRTGLLLQPDIDLDGDLLGTRLPRRGPVPPRVGAGWLVDPAGTRFVQAAHSLPDHATT